MSPKFQAVATAVAAGNRCATECVCGGETCVVYVV